MRTAGRAALGLVLAIAAAGAGVSVRAQTAPEPRQASPEATAHRQALRFAEALPLLEAEAADCLGEEVDTSACFGLVLEAGQVAGIAAIGSTEAAPIERAERHFRQALALADEAFAADDFRLAHARASLGNILANPLPERPALTPARLTEAESLLRAALNAFPEPSQYQFTFDWEQALHGVLVGAGRQAEANAILVARLDRERAGWGDGHRALWQPLRDLAIGLGAAGDAAGAAEAWEEAAGIMAVHFPVDDPQRLAVQAGLANARYAVGDLAGAAAVYAEIEATMGPIGSDFSMLDFMRAGYVSEYTSLLNALGRRREALVLMEARVRWLLALRGATHPDVRAAGFTFASLALQDGQTEEAKELLGALLWIAVQQDGPDAPQTLLLRSTYATALARSGDREAAIAEAEGSLAGLRPAASQNPGLLTAPLWVLGALTLESGRIGEGRGHLSEALDIEARRWCPAVAAGGRPDWSDGGACRPDSGLNDLVATAAQAELHGAPRPGRATRLLAHAGDMALGRARLRVSGDPQARRDFDRSRPLHGAFVTAAWTVHDADASRRIAARPVRTDLSAIEP